MNENVVKTLFITKNCKKTDHSAFRIEQVLKEKDGKSFEQWKELINKWKDFLKDIGLTKLIFCTLHLKHLCKVGKRQNIFWEYILKRQGSCKYRKRNQWINLAEDIDTRFT